MTTSQLVLVIVVFICATASLATYLHLKTRKKKEERKISDMSWYEMLHIEQYAPGELEYLYIQSITESVLEEVFGRNTKELLATEEAWITDSIGATCHEFRIRVHDMVFPRHTELSFESNRNSAIHWYGKLKDLAKYANHTKSRMVVV